MGYASPCALEIEIVDGDREIGISAIFSSSRFRESDVERFLNLNIAFLNAMLERREALDISLGTLFEALGLEHAVLWRERGPKTSLQGL